MLAPLDLFDQLNARLDESLASVDLGPSGTLLSLILDRKSVV